MADRGSAITAQARYEAAVVEALDEPVLGWTVVLRRQPVHLVDGRPEGGYTDSYELICCDCGDNPELDYRDVPTDLQRIRGPYTVSAGIAAYGQHVRLPVHVANLTWRRTGYADGTTG
jgi:hypothetical protein